MTVASDGSFISDELVDELALACHDAMAALDGEVTPPTERVLEYYRAGVRALLADPRIRVIDQL